MSQEIAVKVRKRKRKEERKADVTDQGLLLKSNADGYVAPWDSSNIVSHLTSVLKMDEGEARKVVEKVERQVSELGLSVVDSSLIRELVNGNLVEMGYRGKLKDLSVYQIPREFIEEMMYGSKSNENSNIAANNPEAINLSIAELTLKQWALDAVFSEDVKAAHISGMIHIHDLGYPHRVYCSSHSIEYLKKYGLRNLSNLNTESNPANSASVLTGHLNTYLASMQANYAGALGIAYINIFYAPYLVGMTDDQMYQVAQELIFNGSQNAFSRGGQSLHPSELIWVKENGKYKSVEIGRFADALIDSHSEEILENENYEVFKTENLGFSTISFTRDGGKVQDMPIKYVARMPHKGKMYRIHTSNGIVNVTGDHSLFEFKGAGEIVPTKVKGMKKGDFIVVPHKVEMKDCKDSANLLDYLDTASLSVSDGESVVNAAREKYNGKGAVAKMEKECGVSREILRKRSEQGKIAVDKAKKFVDVEKHEISLKGDSQARIKAILPLTKELGYVAGMYCSEGHNQHKKVIISNMDDSLLHKVTAALDSIGYPWYRKTDPKTYGEACGCVEINGVLGYFIQKSCSENGVKIVPDWAVDANDDCVKGFLEGFYDGEGNGRKKSDGSVLWSVSNTSRKIIAGVSLLQLRFGMETHVYESQAKKSSWNTAWELRESQQRKVNPFSSFTTQEGFDKYRNHVNEKIRQDVEWLKKSDLSVSIIKKIEEYDYEGYVYDISVPETEAFLGGIGSVFFKNTLFLDFNIHTGVPSYLKKIPAVGKGGKYYFLKDGLSLDDKTNWTALEERTENGDWCLYLKNECVLREHDGKQEFTGAGCGRVLTYGDFEEQARKFTVQLLNVWKAGDSKGRVFEFPKCDFHISNETFEDPKQYEVYMKACELASANGSTYFIFDRDEVTLSACCRLRTTIEDNHMLLHPESIRFCGFQNITINIPQCAYRARRKNPADEWSEFFREIDATMDIAVKAHLQKKAVIAELMKGPGRPLWQIGKPANDGAPYVDLEKCTYIIGLIGVNDAVHFLYGKEFHQDEHALDLGLKIVSHMYLRAKHYTQQYGLKFTLEESPAESAARKLAKNDLVYFREEARDIVKGGDEDYAYYTNSVHISADAPVCLVDRIEKQAMFHSIIESGAITHAFVGEERPPKETIAELMKEVFYRTQSAQVTISPEFTYCNACGCKANGIHEKCPQCGSDNVVGETRVVGYFSKIQNWNKSKRYGELVARQKGRYSVMEAGE